MQLIYNGDSIHTEDITLEALLRSKGLLELSGIAAAINQQVISRPQWARQELQERDEIIVITAAAGG